jgi:hypothetical protein
MSSSQPRSVKISDTERGGWSSDRPRRPGDAERPPKPMDVSVRGRVLRPSDRLRYNPGTLVMIACADPALRERLVKRVVDEQGTILSAGKVRALLEGKVAAEELEAKAQQLLDAAVTKRLAAQQSVVIPLETLSAEERERYVRLAAAHRRARHLLLVEVPKDSVPEDDRGPLQDLRTKLDAGALGEEGFMTSLRIGGGLVDELKKIVFSPPPSDD